jgi:hypothetical protein
VFPIPSVDDSCDIVETGFDDWPFWRCVQVCVVILVADRNTPNVSVKNIKDLLLTTEPSSSLIKELTLFLESVSSPMPQSLACQDVKSAQTIWFPLWFLTYWSEISHVLKARQAWLIDISRRCCELYAHPIGRKGRDNQD